MSGIDRAHFYGTLADPIFAEPLRCLHQKAPFSAEHADDFGLTRAGAAARVGTDALLTAGVRQLTTAPVAAWRVTALALEQPGARKTGVIIAPVLGLAGGAIIGATGGVTDVLQAGWYLGVVVPTNVTVAATRRAFKAVERSIDDMWTQIDLFCEVAR
jgi:hypothetical protein